MCFCIEIFLIFSVYFAEICRATPPSYCLENFNRSDCNLTPQKVFSYYKPGSRCEVETWRGCPTLNKFETEEECTNICIFIDSNLADIIPLSGAVNEICLYKPVHVKRCSDKLSKVFVYNTILKSCIPIIWGGCPLPKNVFQDEISCFTVCSQIRGNIMPNTKNNQFDLIISSFLNNISEYLEKLNNSITSSTDKYISTTRSEKRNVTENIIIKRTTEKFLKKYDKKTISTGKIEKRDSKEDMNRYTTAMSTITSTVKLDKPLKATDRTQITSESTTEVIKIPETTPATTTASTTKATETTETTEIETTPTTVTPAPTTQHIVKTTRHRGTAKQVVLPQDL